MRGELCVGDAIETDEKFYLCKQLSMLYLLRLIHRTSHAGAVLPTLVPICLDFDVAWHGKIC